MKRLFPHPVLTTVLLLAWLMLTRFSVGMLIMGAGIAFVAGQAMTRLPVPEVRIHSWRKVLQLTGIVLVDIVRSNIAVVRLIFAGPEVCSKHAGFLELQLEIRDRHALTVLALIITSTPGTNWIEYHPATGRLLLHVLDLVDDDAWREQIHTRYEVLLQEIFECPQ